MTSNSFQWTREGGREKQKMKLIVPLSACCPLAIKAMGILMRSENSLNQHIKLKHPDLWSKVKISEQSHSFDIVPFTSGKRDQELD